MSRRRRQDFKYHGVILKKNALSGTADCVELTLFTTQDLNQFCLKKRDVLNEML